MPGAQAYGKESSPDGAKTLVEGLSESHPLESGSQ